MDFDLIQAADRVWKKAADREQSCHSVMSQPGLVRLFIVIHFYVICYQIGMYVEESIAGYFFSSRRLCDYRVDDS